MVFNSSTALMNPCWCSVLFPGVSGITAAALMNRCETMFHAECYFGRANPIQ